MPSFPSTVGRLLERAARRHPDDLALSFGERHWSYAELNLAAGRVATGLRAEGLRAGDRVAAFGRNSDAYLLLLLGCARAGLVHVPINYNAMGEELHYLLTQSEPRVALVDAPLRERAEAVLQGGGVPSATPGLLELREQIQGWARDDALEPHAEQGVEDTDLVQLLYTSGTTSLPKGAMMSHRALVHEYVSCLTVLDLHRDDVILHSLPLYHSAQMHVFLIPGLAIGTVNHLLEAPDVEEIFRRIPEQSINSLFLPPTLWVDVADHPQLGEVEFDALRKCYYGASIMPVPVLEKLRTRLPAAGFYNCFGQSEIGPLATVLRPEEHEERPASVGRAVLFVETRVVDSEMRDVAPGELGEVVYRSPQLCDGYWGKPQESEEAFRGGWFHSGDLVRIDEAGYMFVVDRIKDVVNTGGVLVATREVEEALYRHPQVAEVAVIGIPHPRWIEAIAAVVVARQEVTAEELVAFCREQLAPHKVPKQIHFAPGLPRNASGKLLKRELRERYGASGSAVGMASS